MSNPGSRAAGGDWMSSALMPFSGDSLPPLRHRLLAEIRDHRVTEDAAYDAALVLAELVGNALKHARPLHDGHLRLRWGCDASQLHVEVTDGGGATEPRPGLPGPDATGGRGLAIVAAVSTDWGVKRGTDSTTVWALLPAPTEPADTVAAGVSSISPET